MSGENTPLAAADPDSLTAYFAGDMVDKPEADIVALVSEVRRRRSVWASEEAVKAMNEKKKRPKATDPATAALLDKPTSELSLDDI